MSKQPAPDGMTQKELPMQNEQSTEVSQPSQPEDPKPQDATEQPKQYVEADIPENIFKMRSETRDAIYKRHNEMMAQESTDVTPIGNQLEVRAPTTLDTAHAHGTDSAPAPEDATAQQPEAQQPEAQQPEAQQPEAQQPEAQEETQPTVIERQVLPDNLVQGEDGRIYIQTGDGETLRLHALDEVRDTLPANEASETAVYETFAENLIDTLSESGATRDDMVEDISTAFHTLVKDTQRGALENALAEQRRQEANALEAAVTHFKTEFADVVQDATALVYAKGLEQDYLRDHPTMSPNDRYTAIGKRTREFMNQHRRAPEQAVVPSGNSGIDTKTTIGYTSEEDTMVARDREYLKTLGANVYD